MCLHIWQQHSAPSSTTCFLYIGSDERGTTIQVRFATKARPTQICKQFGSHLRIIAEVVTQTMASLHTQLQHYFDKGPRLQRALSHWLLNHEVFLARRRCLTYLTRLGIDLLAAHFKTDVARPPRADSPPSATNSVGVPACQRSTSQILQN